jgi:hypothetical protein
MNISEVLDERKKLVDELHELELKLLDCSTHERKKLVKQKMYLTKAIIDNRAKSKALHMSAEPKVTDHAVIRWLERKHGVPIDKLRDIIMKETQSEQNDLQFVIRDKSVVTVISEVL